MADHWQNTHFFKVVDTRERLGRAGPDSAIVPKLDSTTVPGPDWFLGDQSILLVQFLLLLLLSPCSSLYSLKICQQAGQSPFHPVGAQPKYFVIC